MCGDNRNSEYAPEHLLSRLIEKETGAKIEPKLLRLFIKAKWSRITTLAHSIHEQD